MVGVDFRTSLTDARARIGDRYAVQGNLDPALLFAPWDVVERHTRDIVEEGQRAPGHIFNLGHGILPETPVENVQAVVDFVHSYEAHK